MSHTSTLKRGVRHLLRSVSRNPLTATTAQQLSRHGLLPEGIWRRLPVSSEFPVSLGQGKSFRYASGAGDSIGRELYWKGVYSGNEASDLRVFSKLVKKAGRFLDVGANTGLFSLLACALNENCAVTTFEPVPKIYECLKHNIEINGWQERCQLRQEAVSDFLGEAQIHVPASDLPTSASLNPEGFRGCSGEVIVTPVTTIDEACLSDVRIDLMKIDVEGFENAVLRGMTKTLARDKPDLIMECLIDGPYQEVDKILREAGYSFYRMTSQGLSKVSEILPDPHDEMRNFLCSANPQIADEIR